MSPLEVGFRLALQHSGIVHDLWHVPYAWQNSHPCLLIDTGNPEISSSSFLHAFLANRTQAQYAG